MGDLVFNRLHPFVDRPAGASIDNWITALERVPREHSADTIYIFGHAKDGSGATGSRADFARFRDYLTAVLDYTRRQMAAGKSREEITTDRDPARFESTQAPDPPQVSLATYWRQRTTSWKSRSVESSSGYAAPCPVGSDAHPTNALVSNRWFTAKCGTYSPIASASGRIIFDGVRAAGSKRNAVPLTR